LGGEFIGITVEAVGEDEEGGCPETDEDAEAFGMGLGFGRGSAGEIPNGNRAEDGGETEDETEVAEEFKLIAVHRG
jgi:hypothetical protein